MIDAQPEHHLHDVFVVIMDERLASDSCPPLEKLYQALGAVDDRVTLAQFQESPWSTTVLGRHLASPTRAGRVATVRLQRKDLLDAHVVLPAISEVILVEEALADAQSEINQPYLARIVSEADPAVMVDAVLTTVNGEAIEMLVCPTQADLERRVQVRDAAIAADEQAPPDQRADTA